MSESPEAGALFEALWRPRAVEERMLRLLRQGRLSKWFSGIGQEAVAVGVTAALRSDDWILPLHRNLGVFTTRGVDLDRLFRQLLGRSDSFTSGRDRTFHFGSLDDRIVGMISHLGAMLPVACGLALASVLRGEDRVAAVFSGDGGASEGDFHEALNLAAVWRLPVLFVIENNGWGMSTPVAEQYACVDLADRASGYGMPGVVVDGNDLGAVMAAVAEAATRARAGGGPTLFEMKTYRMRGHEEASTTDYVPAEDLERWRALDPLARFEAHLDRTGELPAVDREAIRAAVSADVERRVEAALAAPAPESTPAAELASVFAASPSSRGRGHEVGSPPAAAAPTPDSGSASSASGTDVDRREGAAPATGEPTPEAGRAATFAAPVRPAPGPERDLRYVDAISEALAEAMRSDPTIVLLGQDIAGYGGAFKVTDGFLAEFGAARVRNTPIIESGALGCALGLALDGFRPVVELQFGDFVSCGFNQVVHNLATTHYRWGAPVPVVMRVPVGGGIGAGPFHSQTVEGWFANVPGLRIAAPATPADAKGLLLAAFDEPNPVLFCEHKALYRSVKGPVPAGWHTVPLGECRVARPGTDATVVTWGAGVGWAMEAAERTAAGGGDVEVIDLRWLRPWDADAVTASVERTGRCLVVHEAPLTGGFGAEVAAVVAERCFSALDAPVARVGALDTPIPFRLEGVTSARGRVLPAIERLLAY